MKILKGKLAMLNVPKCCRRSGTFSYATWTAGQYSFFGLQRAAYNKESGLLERGRTVIDPNKRTIF